MHSPRVERSSIIWNTLSSRVVSRPAIATISISPSHPAIHSAAIGLEGVRSISGEYQTVARSARWRGRRRYRRAPADLQHAKIPRRGGGARAAGAKGGDG